MLRPRPAASWRGSSAPARGGARAREATPPGRGGAACHAGRGRAGAGPIRPESASWSGAGC
eukprot:14354431-Alexandrium_andersonii.AAC.1